MVVAFSVPGFRHLEPGYEVALASFRYLSI
jgi:hypothetical protein